MTTPDKYGRPDPDDEDYPAFAVAEAIYYDATSGSATWDELGGPEAEFRQPDLEGEYVVTFPAAWDDDGEPVRWVRILVTTEPSRP